VEGTPFGRYQLIELLGRGGMGEVWRAHDTSLGREVALKMLLPHYAKDPEFEARFRREAQAAARLDDPHVVPIHDVGEIDGRLYVTMRLITGRDLQTLLNAGPLPPDRAVQIVEQIAAALDCAHRAGLVHRDVKPSNILLTDNDFAYLIDFGIARAAWDTALTSANATVGTWAYMAPERFNSGEVAPSSDTYALACVLYQCLTGRVPYPGETFEQVAVGHMKLAPPKPSELQPAIPPAMDAVIATGLAKNPADRYPSGVALATAARQAIGAPTDPRPSRPPVAPSAETLTWSSSGDAQTWSAPAAVTQAWPSAGQGPTVHAGAPASPAPPPSPARRRRPVLIAGVLVAVVLLIAAGVVAVVRFTGDDPDSTATAPSTSTPPSPAGPPPNTGPFTGIYRAEFARPTALDDRPAPGAEPSVASYGVRSACTPKGCMATAVKLRGEDTFASPLVFDEVGDEWVSVVTAPGDCRGVSTESWQTFRLQPRPDGTLVGTHSRTTANSCAEKRAVTFTRTGDVDYNADFHSLPDPGELPPRVASPAEALHGRYHVTRNFSLAGLPVMEADSDVITDCLRTGERCMSYFTIMWGDLPLVYQDGSFKTVDNAEQACPNGALATLASDAALPLPDPPQDPIQTLRGHGTWVQSGGCPVNLEFDLVFERTGN